MEVCFSIVIFMLILVVLVVASATQDNSNKRLLCCNCGYIGLVKKSIQGGCLIELVLWLFFIIPGLIYSVWRLTTKAYMCPKCGNKNLIPENSLIAQKFIKENNIEAKE